MKSDEVNRNIDEQNVVPYAGTWIEIARRIDKFEVLFVVPYAGTWIEIVQINISGKDASVVPYAGTWIEIYT